MITNYKLFETIEKYKAFFVTCIIKRHGSISDFIFTNNKEYKITPHPVGNWKFSLIDDVGTTKYLVQINANEFKSKDSLTDYIIFVKDVETYRKNCIEKEFDL